MIARKGNVTWVLWFWGYSLSWSHGVNAVLVSYEPDEQDFTSARASYYPKPGIIPYTGYAVPLSSTPIYHRVWPAHLHYDDLTRDERTLGHEHVHGCVCVARWKQEGSWGIQSLTQRSRDRQADMLQAQNNPGGIHEWNDRITGVLENLLRWLIMLFMVGRHTAWREKVKLFD